MIYNRYDIRELKRMSAVTVEEIKREIEKVPVEKLETLYQYVRTLSAVRENKLSRKAFLEKMEKIRIDGPTDFAANLDEYLYHGKKFE